MFLALAFATVAARRRKRQWAASGIGVSAVVNVFDRPYSAALMLVLWAASSPASPAPARVQDLLLALAFLPVVRLVRRMVDPRVLSMLFAMVLLYMVDLVRRALGGAPLVEQALLVLESAAAIAALAWLLQHDRLRHIPGQVPPILRSRSGPALLKLLVVALAVGGLTAALGFTRLARMLTPAVLNGGALALILFAAVRVARGALAIALRAWPLDRLQMVGKHIDLLEGWAQRLAFLGGGPGLGQALPPIRRAARPGGVAGQRRSRDEVRARLHQHLDRGHPGVRGHGVGFLPALRRHPLRAPGGGLPAPRGGARHVLRLLAPGALRHPGGRVPGGAGGAGAGPLQGERPRGRLRGRHRLRPAGRGEQLRLRPDPALRAPGARGRHRRGGRAAGRGAAHRHPRQHRAHLPGGGHHRAQLPVHHRQRDQLDAERPAAAHRAAGGRELRRRPATGDRAARVDGRAPTQGFCRPPPRSASSWGTATARSTSSCGPGRTSSTTGGDPQRACHGRVRCGVSRPGMSFPFPQREVRVLGDPGAGKTVARGRAAGSSRRRKSDDPV